jgi:hypothetical protein
MTTVINKSFFLDLHRFPSIQKDCTSTKMKDNIDIIMDSTKAGTVNAHN